MLLRSPRRRWSARVTGARPRPSRAPPARLAVGPPARQLGRDTFVTLLGLYFLVLFPILRADRCYSDDLKRALFGRNGWDSNGRPLTTLLMKLLQCYDHALVDISPLTQVGGVVLLAWVGVMIARRFRIDKPLLAAAVAFPLGAQPFFLENLSFKFDSLSMCLALLLALLPVVALGDDRRGWRLGCLALFASMNLYQPAIGAYLVFAVLELLLVQLRDEPLASLLRRVRSRGLQFVLSMLAYELVVGVHVNGWVRQHGHLIHGIGGLLRVGVNFADFYAFVGAAFDTQWWRYFGPVLALIGLVAVAIGLRHAARAWREGTRAAAVLLGLWAIALPAIALACTLGPLLLLVDPPVVARVLVGIGALLSAGLILLHAAARHWRRSDNWALSVAGMFALGLCSFAAAYGNALAEQAKYEDHIAARLADDLAALRAAHRIDYLVIDGSAGYAPEAGHVAAQFPLVRALVIPYLNAGEMFEAHNFLNYFIPRDGAVHLVTDAPTTPWIAAALAAAARAPAAATASAYDLRLVGDVAVAMFHGPADGYCPEPGACRSMAAAGSGGLR